MKTVLLATFLVTAFANASAQQAGENVVNATGGSFEGNNMNFEWNVGEISLVNTMQSDDGRLNLTNGCLQPMHHMRARHRTADVFAGPEVSILPNPTAHRVWIQIQAEGTGKMTLMLFNERGESVYNGEVTYSGGVANASINMTKVANGTYILHVKLFPSNGFPRKSGSYRIVKIS
jgi:hypothetical protein